MVPVLVLVVFLQLTCAVEVSQVLRVLETELSSECVCVSPRLRGPQLGERPHPHLTLPRVSNYYTI